MERNFGNMKWLVYFIIVLFTIIPFIVLAYFVEFRLFILFPVLWIKYLFFRGIEANKVKSIELLFVEVQDE